MPRQHVATVLGIPPATPRPPQLRRRDTDTLARPRVIVYVEDDRVDVITEGDVILTGVDAVKLAIALLDAGRLADPTLEAPGNDEVDR